MIIIIMITIYNYNKNFVCVVYAFFFSKTKISNFQKKKMIFEEPKTPCFGGKVAATGRREGSEGMRCSPT